MNKFYVVSSEILPDVLEKVLEAQKLLHTGKFKKISEAVKEVGISRGTFYKYKDAVFAFNQDQSRRKANIMMVLKNEKGALSQVLSLISSNQVNVLAINQSLPIDGIATVTITIDITELEIGIQTLLTMLSGLHAVVRTELIAIE